MDSAIQRLKNRGQKVDSATHWINHYLVYHAIGFSNIYQLKSIIYLTDSAIQRLNNRGLETKLFTLIKLIYLCGDVRINLQ